jgi:hypothetical protein
MSKNTNNTLRALAFGFAVATVGGATALYATPVAPVQVVAQTVADTVPTKADTTKPTKPDTTKKPPKTDSTTTGSVIKPF